MTQTELNPIKKGTVRFIWCSGIVNELIHSNVCTLNEVLKEIESLAILGALSRTNQDCAKAARLLGLKRSTLAEKRRRMHMPMKPYRAPKNKGLNNDAGQITDTDRPV